MITTITIKIEQNNNNKNQNGTTQQYLRSFEREQLTLLSHPKASVAGVDSKLNSATGTPRLATLGANMAAG